MRSELTPRWAAAGLAALAGLAVFHGGLAYFFSQDDFAALARAAGILPRFVEPWRLLSLQWFFDAMRPLAGLDATPYHAASLVGHALATALVVALIARTVGAAAALVGGAFFATHAAHFTAVYWISAIGDVWALVFGVAALLAGHATGRRRWLSPVAFALSLLCKESLILLPLAFAGLRILVRPVDADPPRARANWRDGPSIAMFVIMAAYLVYFVIDNGLAGGGASKPYAATIGLHVGANLLTYLGWTANAWLGTVRGFSDAIDPSVYGWGAGLALAMMAGAFIPALRQRGWNAGIALFLLFLAPVLPLAHHTYHYYLYGAMAGVAWLVAAAFDTVFGAGGRRPARAEALVGWAAACALTIALGWNGSALVRKIETMPFQHPGLRADPIVDRALIADRVRVAFAETSLPPEVDVVFWCPEARPPAAAGNAGAQAPDTYWEQNVRAALYDGVAVRVLDPRVRGVRFAKSFDGGAAGTWWAVYGVTGRTRLMPSAVLDSLLERSSAQGPSR